MLEPVENSKDVCRRFQAVNSVCHIKIFFIFELKFSKLKVCSHSLNFVETLFKVH